ncbi:MAG: lytic transglycosylase domain-containing protein [Alphaproteobacteria bacterium]|nr:lytic transglycosylase domain-containing protein [Alphaproteobacteria bacterium]
MALSALLAPAQAEVFGRLSRGAPDACRIAIDRIEREANIPAQLMSAISMVESGRSDPDTGEKIAWPWTVNNAGDGRYFDTKAQAIAHVRELVRRGQLNIDVGCMQINLMYHPEAFIDLDEAFDPLANVAYAARYLKELRDAKHSWSLAVANYHSATPERGQIYRKKVFDAWTQARLEYDRQNRAAVVAEFQALREKRAQLAAARGVTASGVTILRPRDTQDRFGWIRPAAPGGAGAQRPTASGLQRLTLLRSAPRTAGNPNAVD